MYVALRLALDRQAKYNLVSAGSVFAVILVDDSRRTPTLEPPEPPVIIFFSKSKCLIPTPSMKQSTNCPGQPDLVAAVQNTLVFGYRLLVN